MCMLRNSVRRLGKIFWICVSSVLAPSELVAYTLQWPGRIRPHFAFWAASDLGTLPGTEVRPFLKTESLRGVKDLLTVKTIIPPIMGSSWGNSTSTNWTFAAGLLCYTKRRPVVGSELNWQRRVGSEQDATHADSLNTFTHFTWLVIGKALCSLCQRLKALKRLIRVGHNVSTTRCRLMLSWERLNVTPAATYHLFSQSGTGVQLWKINSQLQTFQP